MFNIDVSKVVHPRFWEILPAFLPGLFFEVCLSLGNSQLAGQLTKQAHLAPYPLTFVAVLIAFVIGIAFMYWVQTVQWSLRKLAQHAWPPVRENLSALIAKSSSRLRNSIARLQKQEADVSKGATEAITRTLARLLESRYGIGPSSEFRSEEWDTWFAVLFRFGAQDIRGPLLMMTSQATGWAALAAVLLAPGLRNWPFLLLAIFLSGTGVINDWLRFTWLERRGSYDLVALSNLLAAIPQPRPEEVKPKDQPPEA